MTGYKKYGYRMETNEFIRYIILLCIVAILLSIINIIISRAIDNITRKRIEKMEYNQFVTSTDKIILEVGEQRKISAFAANISQKPVGGYKVVWSINNTLIADVSFDGKVTAKTPGITTVYTGLRKVDISNQKYSRKQHYSRGMDEVIFERNRELDSLQSETGIRKEIKVFVIHDGMAMVSHSEFILGGGDFNALPVQKIYLDDYIIDKYEVTNAQFSEFLNSDNDKYFNSQMHISRKDGHYGAKKGKENFPVVFVDWYGASAYSQFVGKRLPTECEWEKAARGDKDNRNYPGGDTILSNEANFRNSGDPYEMGPTPIGFYNGVNVLADGDTAMNSLSQYGAYDMSGNVLEWVNDWYNKDYYKLITTNNPTGPDSSVEKSIRGGGWFDTPARLNVSYRTSGKPDLKNEMVGFRCAKSLDSMIEY